MATSIFRLVFGREARPRLTARHDSAGRPALPSSERLRGPDVTLTARRDRTEPPGAGPALPVNRQPPTALVPGANKSWC